MQSSATYQSSGGLVITLMSLCYGKHTNITVLTYKKATKKKDWNTRHNRRPKHNTPNLEALAPNTPTTILLSHVQQEYPKTVSPKRFSNTKLWSFFSAKCRCITKNLEQVLRNFKKLFQISQNHNAPSQINIKVYIYVEATTPLCMMFPPVLPVMSAFTAGTISA